MKKIIAAFAAFLVLGPAFSADLPADTKAALQTLVASQNIDKYWPAIISNAADGGVGQIQKSALAVMEQNRALTPADREILKKIIAETSPQVAIEIKEFQQGLNIDKLVSDMAEKIYPKHYTRDEILELAKFFRSTAYQKVTALGIEIRDENKRTGEDVTALWKKYDARLTTEEKKAFLDFNESPLGKKQLTVGPKVGAESLEYLKARIAEGYDPIITRYSVLVREKFLAATKD
ncbi:MAG: DUF2059 domain-containing protein [Pseudomonadota bacterium]